MQKFIVIRHSLYGVVLLSTTFFFVASSLHTVRAETYVFSANKTQTASSNIGANVLVIGETEIQQAQKENITALLKTSSGIHITESSANGAKGVMIRGSGNAHTLVMIDGVVVNDPISTGRDFNFANLSSDNIEKIEVLKGAQSVLYGSDAMGGVVQIFTKKGNAAQKFSSSLALEGGSYGLNRQSLNVNGSLGDFNYSLGVSNLHEQGISAADKKAGNRERDGNTLRSGFINLSHMPLDWLLVDLNLRHVKGKLDYDLYGGEGGDRANLWQDYQSTSGRLGLTTYLWDERIESSLSYDQNSSKRYDTKDVHEMLKDTSKSYFKSKTQNWAQKNILRFHPDFETIFGFNHLTETGKSAYVSKSYYGDDVEIYETQLPKQKQISRSLYLDQHLNFGSRWFNTLGIRRDRIGEEVAVTYRITSRYNVTDYLAFKGSYGTGFKAPTLYQKFDQTYGNLDLKSEKSNGYDLGIVLTHKNHSLELIYFNNDVFNLIDFDTVSEQYYNLSKSRMRGVEFGVYSNWNEYFSTKLFYTYLDARNKVDQMPLLRRPRHHVGIIGNIKISDQHSIYLDANYFSHTQDFKSVADTSSKLKAYWLVNVAYEYQMNKNLSFTAKVNNVLDTQYQTALGYGQKRINGALGLKINF